MADHLYDAVIVGAGPVGSYSSVLLASKGFSIALLEEHTVIGRPVQCAGLVNSRIASLPKIGTLFGSIMSRISGADLFSPNGTRLELRARTEKALSIDRASFDGGLARLAIDIGVDLKLGCKVSSINRTRDGWIVSTNGIEGRTEVRGSSIILCDGSDHRLRRALGMDIPREFVPGISCEVQAERSNFDPGNVAVFTGRDIAPGFFAWAIPAGDNGRLKLGLCTSFGGDIRSRLKRFMRSDALGSWICSKGGPCTLGEISMTFGTVPIGPVEPYQRPGILLLGDAAGMAKPTSGGGIYPGLLACDALSRSVEADGGGVNDAVFSRFSRSWKRGYGRELKRSMMLRDMIKEVKDHEIDLALGKLQDSKVMDYINEKGDIDRPYTLAAGVFARDPSLMNLIPRFIPRMMKVLGS